MWVFVAVVVVVDELRVSANGITNNCHFSFESILLLFIVRVDL